MPHTFSRLGWSAAVLLLAAAFPALSAAAQEPIPQRIRIDLGSGATRSSLPFDEPIVVVGSADSLMVGMRLRYHDVASLEGELAAGEKLEKACEDSEEWEATPVWRRRAGIPSDTFSLLLPALSGEKLFVFCMVPLLRPGSGPAAATQLRLASALDQMFRDNATADEMTGAELDTLHLNIVALLKPTPGDSLDIVAGSLFSRDSATAAGRLQQIINLQQFHDDRTDAITNFGTHEPAAKAALHTLLSDLTAFTALTGAFSRGRRPPGVSDAAAMCALTAARFFAVPSAGTLDRVAVGEVALSEVEGPPPLQLKSLTLAWEAADIAPRLDKLARTQECLGGLRAMGASLVASKALQDSVGVKHDDALRMVTHLDAARTELGQLQSQLTLMSQALERRSAKIREAAVTVTRLSELEAPVVGSTLAVSFDARARRYLSMDLGVLHAPNVDATLPYYGVSLTLCPVNKRVRLPPLWSDPGSLCKRLSAVAGLTIKSAARTDEREDLFGSTSGVLGLGVRVLDVFRVTGGGLILRDLGGTAAESTNEISWTPFVSFSFDLDVRQLFSDLSTLITR